MKIAYLLLCHTNEEQLNLLIKQIANDDADIYVHIDAKTHHFNLRSTKNLVVLDENKRVDVRWGTFSMIDATLSLLNACLSSGTHYDYYILLSGQDFPVKKNSQLIEFLESNNGCNFIGVLPRNYINRSVFLKRNELYYPEWAFLNSKLIKRISNIYIILSGGSSYTWKTIRRNNVCGMQFEFGSQWWCLHRDFILWMMNYIQEHPDYLRFFRHSIIPDESFFQTLFMNSPFVNSKKNMITFVKWKEKSAHPSFIDVEDIESLLNNDGVFFARKFDYMIDPKPIDKIISMITE